MITILLSKIITLLTAISQKDFFNPSLTNKDFEFRNGGSTSIIKVETVHLTKGVYEIVTGIYFPGESGTPESARFYWNWSTKSEITQDEFDYHRSNTGGNGGTHNLNTTQILNIENDTDINLYCKTSSTSSLVMTMYYQILKLK